MNPIDAIPVSKWNTDRMRGPAWLRAGLTIALFCLAPTAVWANGFGVVEAGFNFTLGGTAIGCVVGLVVALCRRSGTGGLFAWTIGAGLGLGLGGALMFVMAHAPSFFPNNPEFALMIIISAVLVAGIGGSVLALMGWVSGHRYAAIQRATNHPRKPYRRLDKSTDFAAKYCGKQGVRRHA